MATPKLDLSLAQQAVDAYLECNQSKTEAAALLGIPPQTFTHRLKTAKAYGLINDISGPQKYQTQIPFNVLRVDLEGPVVFYSDAHFWPNIYSDAFWILLQVIKDLKPVAVFDGGDYFDGARISRHPRNGWEERPGVPEELGACKLAKGMIKDAAGEAELREVWSNHATRFDSFLSARVPEYQGVPGFSLQEHFPDWQYASGFMINDGVIVCHDIYGGVHADYNNVLKSGVTTITGHTHHLRMRPYSDLRGTRYGIETGTLADPMGPQFAYAGARTRDWQSGFVVGYFDGPDHRFETVEVRNGKALFGGRIWRP